MFNFIITAGVYAQTAVLLQHAGASSPYYGTNGFRDAYTASIHGDTILLPGGFFAPPDNIDKRIAIIGTGHNPDSTAATLGTVITSGIGFGDNADSCLLMGMLIKGNVSISYNAQANYLTLSRLYIEGGISTNGDGNYFAVGCIIRECVIIGSITGYALDRCNIVNNILHGGIYSPKGGMISNNVFLGGDPVGESSRPLNGVRDCIIRNNVFYKSVYDWINCVNNQFQRNIFKNEPAAAGNMYSNNYINVNTITLFVNYSGGPFTYAANFHLDSPNDYPGTDATQVGLYGSSWPWKEGSVPVTPHIQTKSIAEQTSANGTIQVQVKVAAQNQ